MEVMGTCTRWAVAAETTGNRFISCGGQKEREFSHSMPVTDSGLAAQAALITAFSDGDGWSLNRGAITLVSDPTFTHVCRSNSEWAPEIFKV